MNNKIHIISFSLLKYLKFIYLFILIRTKRVELDNRNAVEWVGHGQPETRPDFHIGFLVVFAVHFPVKALDHGGDDEGAGGEGQGGARTAPPSAAERNEAEILALDFVLDLFHSLALLGRRKESLRPELVRIFPDIWISHDSEQVDTHHGVFRYVKAADFAALWTAPHRHRHRRVHS